MQRLDPFIRNCLLSVLIATVPALIVAALGEVAVPPELTSWWAFSYAALMAIIFVAWARKNAVWRVPVGMNFFFFVVIGLAGLTL